MNSSSSKPFPLYVKILIGMIVGIIIGLLAVNFQFDKIASDWISPWGDIFLRLLKLVAVPLVFVSLVKGVCGLKSINSISKLGGKTLGIYIITTVIAITIGLIIVNIMEPGRFFPHEKAVEWMTRYEQTVEEKSIEVQAVKNASPLQFVVDMVPDNIFFAAGDNSKMLQIIFVSLLFGIAIVIVGEEKTATLRHFISDINDVILKIIDLIMNFAPLGVLALMTELIVSFSGDIGMFAALGMYALTVIVSLFVIILLFYPLLIKIFTKKTLKHFFKAIFPVQILAFSTSSSAATLPLTMEQAENELKISKETASFVLPVGVTVNMDGTSCYQAVAVVFLAQVMGMDLSFTQMLTILLTATISSIGTPGIPGGSIVMLLLVLSSVGIPAEGLALILGIDRPLDMLRTVVNVTGDTTVACVVDTKKPKIND